MSLFRKRPESFSEEPLRPEESHRGSHDENDESYTQPGEEYLSYAKERQERRRQKALQHLLESGRAKSPEEAERYLERINRIQEKLILFVRAFQSNSEAQDTLQILSGTSFQYPNIGIESSHGRLHKLTETDLAKLSSDKIDKTHPRLWSLKRSIDSFKDSNAFIVDSLSVDVAHVGRIAIYPDVHGGSETVEWLQKYLSDEDLQFLKQEYHFALGDVARQLRHTADKISGSQVAPQFAENWKSLFRNRQSEE